MTFFASFIILFNILLSCEARAGGTTIALGRSQSMTAAAASRSRFSPFKQSYERVHTEPELSSSSSLHEIEQRPPSPIHRESENLLETNHRVSFAPTIDLADASRVTNEANIIPTRDGVFARINQVLFGSLASAAAGIATGAGIVEIINSTKTLSNVSIIPTENPEAGNVNIIG